MSPIRPAVVAALTCPLLLAGCGGEPEAEQFGWFSYDAPDGWAKHDPGPAVTYAPTFVEFRPASDDPTAQPRVRLEVREVTDDARFERIPELFMHTQDMLARSQRKDTAKNGMAAPPFSFTPVTLPVTGPGTTSSFAVTRDRDGEPFHALVAFVAHPDGRHFRAEYRGTDPDFGAHRAAVTASLASLSFHAGEPPPAPTHDQVVAAFAEHLEGDRLWLYDGTVAGRRLNDDHLAALKHPTFAGLTDLNVISGPDAMMGGVDVTDVGLAHIAHLELRSLCLRGSLVTDAGLAHLKDMPLKSLVLEGALIEGHGLAHLAGMKSLQVLDLANTSVGDEDLVHLEDLPVVQVFLRRTNVTEEGLAALQTKLPDLYVSHE